MPTATTTMLDSSVLVLNKSFLPIHVTSARRAFSMIYQDVARAVNENYETFDFESWASQAVADHGPEGAGNGQKAGAVDAIGTGRGRVRIPRVIVLRQYDRVPRLNVRYSRLNVFVRDRYTCQYCGVSPHRSQLNLDHVVPRALGGKTTWENVVCSCIECNRRKGGRTPEQARFRLRRKPTRPRWMPLANLGVTGVRYEEWRPFLAVVDGSRRSPAAEAEAS